MRSKEDAFQKIRDALDRIKSDARTPVRIDPTATLYLQKLARHGVDDEDAYTNFSRHLPSRAIRNALLEQALSKRIIDLLDQREVLAEKKEHEVMAKRFDIACEYLEEQRRVEQRIRSEVQSLDPVITPALLERTLKSLGFPPLVE